MATETMLLNGREMKTIPLNAVSAQLWEEWFGKGAEVNTPAYFYTRLPWLFAAVNLVANAVGSMPVRWYNAQGEAIEDENALDWLQSWEDLVNAIAGDMVMYGAGYISRGNNRRGVPTEMRRLLPTTIKPELDPVKGLTGFTRTVNSQKVPLPLTDVVYVWQPNRTGEIGPGTAPAQAALLASGALANIDSTTELLFQNGAIRPTLVTFEGLSLPAEQERVQSWLDRAVSGVRNAFRPLAVGTTITPTTLGDKPGELTMPELTESKRQDISTALGVPHTLLFSNAANYATSHQDTLNFYDMTVIPLARRIHAALNDQLFSTFGVTVETAEEELEFYQQMQGEQVTALATMFRERVITVNEFRERAGFDPLEDPSILEPEPEPETVQPEDDLQDMPEPEGNDSDRQQRDELRTWERFTVRRLKEGKPLRAFKAEYLPAAVVGDIEAQIEDATTVDAVKAVFDRAEHWIGYP